jgi:hypothetical protein
MALPLRPIDRNNYLDFWLFIDHYNKNVDRRTPRVEYSPVFAYLDGYNSYINLQHDPITDVTKAIDYIIERLLANRRHIGAMYPEFNRDRLKLEFLDPIFGKAFPKKS